MNDETKGFDGTPAPKPEKKKRNPKIMSVKAPKVPKEPKPPKPPKEPKPFKEKKKKPHYSASIGEGAFHHLTVMSTERTTTKKYWAKDPKNQMLIRMVSRITNDVQKVGIAVGNRIKSPVLTVNEALLLPGDLKYLNLLSFSIRGMEAGIKSSAIYAVRESEIGQWLLSHKGLGSGWLAACMLGEFPDIYDSAICRQCGTHLKRTAPPGVDLETASVVNWLYVHPKLPGSIVTHEGPIEEVEIDEFIGDVKPVDCKLQELTVPATHYVMHEKKPSTFISFAGLATVDGYGCPLCEHNIYFDGKNKVWKHPNYTKSPNGQCPMRDKQLEGKRHDVPWFTHANQKIECTPRRISPKREAGQPLTFKSLLRTKLIGPQGIAEQFVMNRHPEYSPMYANYKHRIKVRDGHFRSDGWIDAMAKRFIMYHFTIAFFVKWREVEGLPCRKPYAEEKLGIIHHP